MDEKKYIEQEDDMREILFRGKQNGGEWVEGCLLFDEERNEAFIAEYFEYRSAYIREVIPETLGQYIGLTDKNGKKVFEGDIVQTKTKFRGRIKTFRFVIKYGKYIPLEYCRECYSQYKTIGFYAFDGEKDFQLGSCSEVIEVIGNIHDNPELLKGGVE